MRFRVLPPVVFLVLGLAAGGPSAGAASGGASTGRADFTGTWKLVEEKGANASSLIRGGEASSAPGRGGRGGGGEGGGRRGGGREEGSGGASPVGAAGLEVPSAALEEERLLVIRDDGDQVRVTRSRGRLRVLFTDGDQRELDDGDGPALVTTKRKRSDGGELIVSSKWPTDRKVQETWELQSNPRHLVITTKVSGRRSFTYKRIYEPAPDVPPEALAAPTPRPGAAASALPIATATPAAPAAPAAPVSPPAGKSACSVRPPKGTPQAELSRMARISQADAERRVISFVAPRQPTSIITSDVEVDAGCLVFTFDLRFADRKGVQEVAIDAGDGKILTSELVDN